MDISLKSIAHILGGELRGNQVLAPGPGHSREDRSLSIKTNDRGDDIVVHSFAHDDPVECKKYVREKCGIQFKPNGKQRFSEDDITRAVLAATEAKAPKSKPIAIFDYRDSDGTLLYQVLRFPPKFFRHAGRMAMAAGFGNWKTAALFIAGQIYADFRTQQFS